MGRIGAGLAVLNGTAGTHKNFASAAEICGRLRSRTLLVLVNRTHVLRLARVGNGMEVVCDVVTVWCTGANVTWEVTGWAIEQRARWKCGKCGREADSADGVETVKQHGVDIWPVTAPAMVRLRDRALTCQCEKVTKLGGDTCTWCGRWWCVGSSSIFSWRWRGCVVSLLDVRLWVAHGIDGLVNQ